MDKPQNYFTLILNALNAPKNEHPLLAEFRRIVEDDYKTFAREENSLPNEVDMFEKIRQIELNLERLLNFPALKSKTIGAVAGAFSSGKSAFINSFLTGKDIHLAEDIEPTTAIPSYVIYGEASKITGYNNYGASFGISPEVYASITHDAMQKLEFDLRDIIPYITISSPMEKNLFEHICLIDTPGHNAASMGTSEKDKSVAAASIENADFLLWIIDLDRGCIEQSDIEFLTQERLCFGKSSVKTKETRDLYIIFNKKNYNKTEKDIVNILNVCEQSLNNANLSYAGICCLDPFDPDKTLISPRVKNLFVFLAEKNKPNLNIESLYQPLRFVLDSYKGYINSDINKIAKIQNALKNLKNSVYYAIKNENAAVIDTNFSGLEKALNIEQNNKLKRQLTNIDNIRKKFDMCFVEISRELGDKTWQPQPRFCWSCGGKLQNDSRAICQECGARQN